MADRHGTEVSFRLGPGRLAEAREIAEWLAESARGCRRHVLFVDAENGEYGCLAEWDDRESAEGYAHRAAAVQALERISSRAGRPARVRVYSMEEQRPRP